MSKIQNTSTKDSLSFPLPDLELVRVEGHKKGQTFKMGGTEDEDEQPIHDVHIGYSFYMGRFQVTQGLYEKVMEKKHPSLKKPSRFKGSRRSVEKVSWEDTKLFFAALEEMDEIKDFKKKNEKFSNYEFRLPTEAEWEFAARGGINSQGYNYCGSDDLKQVGWYDKNSGMETKPVGLLLPNELGIYDMSGNVYEWCEDDWHSDYNSAIRPDDGSAWKDSPRAADRVIRGGNCFSFADGCRPAYRISTSPDYRYDFLGFRLVFSLQS